ncbi:MAG: hypothetical protein Q3962_04490 [Corynebacterium sp.]|nr:hypothetical protein [Corynebacterium sp.]
MKKKTLALAAACAIAFPSIAGYAFADSNNTTAVATDTAVSNVALKWDMSNFASNFVNHGMMNLFVAGKFDGTQANYKATDGDVNVYLGDGTQPTWETRTSFATVNPAGQYFTIGNGSGALKSDGSAVISWPSADTVTLSAYSGMVLVWMNDFKLTVNADHTASLTADLSGQSTGRDGGAPSATPAMDDAVIANFSDFTVGQNGTIEATPLWSQVKVPAAPQGARAAAQYTTDGDWGSWPADMVNFAYANGLSSYFYSSKAGDSEEKRPHAVSFTIPQGKDAVILTETATATQTETSVETATSTATTTTTAAAEPVTTTATATATETATTTETVAPTRAYGTGFGDSAKRFWDELLGFLRGGGSTLLSFFGMIFYPLVQLFK